MFRDPAEDLGSSSQRSSSGLSALGPSLQEPQERGAQEAKKVGGALDPSSGYGVPGRHCSGAGATEVEQGAGPNQRDEAEEEQVSEGKGYTRLNVEE